MASASASRWTRWRCSSGPVKSVRGPAARLECLPVVAEADDHRARIDVAQRLQQDVDALVVEELPEVDDRRLLVLRERPPAARRCPRPGAARSALPGFGGSRRASSSSPASASARGRGRQSSTSTPGGTSWTRSTWPTTSCSTSRMCAEPTKTASACSSASLPHAPSASLPRIEYSSSDPCALTANRAPLAAPTGPPSRTWFAKTRSAGRCSRSAAAFALDPRVELGPRAVLDELHLVALVAVEHEHRQQPADVRPYGDGAAEVVERPGRAPG